MGPYACDFFGKAKAPTSAMGTPLAHAGGSRAGGGADGEHSGSDGGMSDGMAIDEEEEAGEGRGRTFPPSTYLSGLVHTTVPHTHRLSHQLTNGVSESLHATLEQGDGAYLMAADEEGGDGGRRDQAAGSRGTPGGSSSMQAWRSSAPGLILRRLGEAADGGSGGKSVFNKRVVPPGCPMPERAVTMSYTTITVKPGGLCEVMPSSRLPPRIDSDGYP